MRQNANATFLYCLRARPPRARLSPATPAPTAPPQSVGVSGPLRGRPPRARLTPATPAPTAPPKSVGVSGPVASVWAAVPSRSKAWEAAAVVPAPTRSEEHTSELQSL